MARPREFDVDEAVEKAMQVFWEKGYEGTSLPDLLNGMNIARGSLYKAFGSKKELFIRALDRYDEIAVGPGVHLLEHGPGGSEERIAKVFQNPVGARRAGDNRGCLLCNSTGGLSIADEDISRRITKMLNRLTSAFVAALRADNHASDRSETELVQQARGLTASYVGLNILSRSGEAADVLDQVVNAVVSGSR